MMNEAALWQAFKQGDKKAFATIFDTYYPAMYQYGSYMVRDEALLKDSIHDVLLRVWQTKERLADVYSIKAYLFKSLKMKLIGSQKKPSFPVNYSAYESFELSYESILINQQENEHLIRQLDITLQKLSKRQQEAIYLRFYNRMSYEEISEVMSISQQASRNLIYTAIKFLRENMLPILFCVSQFFKMVDLTYP